MNIIICISTHLTDFSFASCRHWPEWLLLCSTNTKMCLQELAKSKKKNALLSFALTWGIRALHKVFQSPSSCVILWPSAIPKYFSNITFCFLIQATSSCVPKVTDGTRDRVCLGAVKKTSCVAKPYTSQILQSPWCSSQKEAVTRCADSTQPCSFQGWKIRNGTVGERGVGGKCRDKDDWSFILTQGRMQVSLLCSPVSLSIQLKNAHTLQSCKCQPENKGNRKQICPLHGF